MKRDSGPHARLARSTRVVHVTVRDVLLATAILLATPTLPVVGAANDETKSPLATASNTPVILRQGDIGWLTRASGVRVAVLYGDTREDGPFVLRLEYPAGYEKGPHYHPDDAYVSVMWGAYSRGYGATWNRKQAFALRPGTFSVNPAGVSHYEWTRDGAALQVVARGPWKSVYLDEEGNPIDAMETPPDLSQLQEPLVRRAEDLEWIEQEPGVETALLDGDPNSSGPFTMRLRLTEGYAKGAHTHSSLTFVTVLSGSLRIGLGDSADAPTTLLEAGSFVALPPGTAHFETAPEDVVVELHSQGRWTSESVQQRAHAR